MTLAPDAHAQAPASPPGPSSTQGYAECTKKASKEDVEAAKSTHRAATQYYERADYDKAIQYWGDAYNLDCSANDLLLNIANAYEKKGDRAATVVAIETYLKRTGSNPTLEEKVRNLKALIAAPPAPPAAPTAPTSPPPVATNTAGPMAPIASSTATTAPPPSTDGSRPYGAKPWILVGSGGVLAVVGIILLPVGYGNTSSATSTCPNSVCPNSPAGLSAQSTGNTGRSEIGAGFGLLAIGAAAAAGGLVWQFAFNQPGSGFTSGPAARNLWLTPTASKDGSGVVIGGAF